MDNSTCELNNNIIINSIIMILGKETILTNHDTIVVYIIVLKWLLHNGQT